MKHVAAAWDAHERAHTAAHEYAITCNDVLIDALVEAARSEIARTLPTLTPYRTPPPPPDALTAIAPDVTIEGLLNQAAALLFLAPAAYAAWEPLAMQACARLAAEAAARHTERLGMAKEGTATAAGPGLPYTPPTSATRIVRG